MNDADRVLKAVVSKLRIKQLQLLISLEEHKSLRKAAAAMFMTQSAASKALQEIEGMLGMTLFERTRAGLVPNAMGHCAIRYATLISSELAYFCREVQDIRSGAGGSLVIGTIMGAVPRVLVSALASLRAAYPNLSVEIIEGTSSHLLKLLDDGRIDLMIGRPGVSAEPYEYSYYPVSGEPTSVVVGSRHPEIAGEMSFAQLRDFRWVVYPRRMPLRILLEKEMNLAGLIRILPIDLKIPADTYGIVTRKTGTTTAVVQLLIDAARNHTLGKSGDPSPLLPATWP